MRVGKFLDYDVTVRDLSKLVRLWFMLGKALLLRGYRSGFSFTIGPEFLKSSSYTPFGSIFAGDLFT